MQTTNNNVPVEKIIKISHVPAAYRTLDETTAYANFLSNFEFFRSKVLDNSLDEVLNLATKHLKYSRIPAGQFLYHHGQPSNCIYLVLKGEAWKFRQKTEKEFELDHLLKQKKANAKEIPKILETIALAKAQMARNKVQLPVPSPIKASTPNTADKGPVFPETTRTPRRPPRDLHIETKQAELSAHVKEEDKAENKSDVDSAKMNQNTNTNMLNRTGTRRIGEGILKKLKDTKNVLNFENDYLFNLIKRNVELNARYMKDKNCLLKYEKKYGQYDTLGEMSMSLNQIRTSSVLAYTELHVFYLDQKSYEKVFFAQIEEIREKLDFFTEYFKELNFNTLKKLVFLFTERKFKLGELLYKEGSPCDNLYFIKSGEVQLVKKLTVDDGFHSSLTTETDLNVHTSHKTEKSVLVASVRDGNFCGEEVLSGEPTRNFTAKSMSYLTCYVVSPQVLSRLPERVIRNLQEMSMPHKNWRGNRLEDIKSQPLFKNIQKNLSLTALSRERTKGGSRTDSIGTESSLEKSTSQDRRHNTERLRTPRRVDLSSTEYGFFQNKKNQGNQNTHTINIIKPEETPSPYKLSVRKLSIEKRNSFLERNIASSRSRRKTRLMIDQENQKTLESIKYSLHPSSSRSQRKKIEKTFEIRPSSEESEESVERNPSCEILQANDSSDMSDEGFEYNFITKQNKRKNGPPPATADKKDLTIARDRSKGLKVDTNPVKNQENQRESSPRVIYTPKSYTLKEANYKKLKGSLLNLMNKQKASYYYQNSGAEVESANYFMIKTVNTQQGVGFGTLRYIEDSKGLSPRGDSMSMTKGEISLSPKHKNSSVVIRDRSQLLHVQGSKVRGVF